MNAGLYPLTIEIWTRISEPNKDALGHKVYNWKRTNYAAARRWEITNAERTSAAFESLSNTIRLLCRSAVINTNQQIRWQGQRYKVTASEVRDRWDCLITLEPM